MFTTYVWTPVHVGTWSVGNQTLVVGVNLDSQGQTIALTQLPGWRENAELEVLYALGTTIRSGYLVFEGLGATGFVFSK